MESKSSAVGRHPFLELWGGVQRIKRVEEAAYMPVEKTAINRRVRVVLGRLSQEFTQKRQILLKAERSRIGLHVAVDRLEPEHA